MADVKAIAEELVNLTVKEVNELVNVLKEDYGIEPAAAAVAVAAGPAADAAAGGAAEEKTEFDVILKDAGAARCTHSLRQLVIVDEFTAVNVKAIRTVVMTYPQTVPTVNQHDMNPVIVQ